MEKFKIRASAGGMIMTDPRKSQTGLSKTTQGYVEQWVKEQLYDRRKEFYSKYTDRGIVSEDAAINLVSEFLKLGYVAKNYQFFEDDHFTGTPDLILSDCVIDVKCSWDCFTFPLFDQYPPESQYVDQLQIYMELTGKTSAKLIYTLIDMPGHLLEREMRYKASDLGMIELEPEQEQEIISKNTYSHLPYDLRIKIFEITKDTQRIDAMRVRVEECRNYIDSLKLNISHP